MGEIPHGSTETTAMTAAMTRKENQTVPKEALTVPQLAAVMAVLAGVAGAGTETRRPRGGQPPRRKAWMRREVLRARGHELETIESLIALDWLAVWERPKGIAVTLTPWGAWETRHELVEHWERGSVEEKVRDDRGKFKTVRTAHTTEVAHWVEMRFDEKGRRLPPGPIKLPGRHQTTRFCDMPRGEDGEAWAAEEELVDASPGPTEYLVDADSGEASREENRGMKILEALVPIDNRSGWGTAARVRRPKKRPKSGGPKSGGGAQPGDRPQPGKTRRERRAEARAGGAG